MTPAEIDGALRSREGWTVKDGALFRRFEFSNFAESLAFVNRVGEIAEAADHHPDITFGWGYAELRTTTHDRGGITDVDFALVEKIERI
jgi:4a-hydroxytetrahydrobiopterin dehydratase